MKKIITLLLFSQLLMAESYNRYESKFGLGVGIGFPSGYEAKAIYRQSEWLSLSLNYNLFEIKNLNYTVDDGSNNFTAMGDIQFSTPGIMAHIHPLGDNFRVSAGFLWDFGEFRAEVDGSIDLSGPVDVAGYVDFGLGKTYPYLGVGYGYSFNSTVHVDLSAGVYLIKAPQASLYVTSTDIDSVLDTLGVTDPTDRAQIKAELAKVDNNLLDIGAIYQDVIGVDIGIPSSSELEGLIVESIQQGLDTLPSIGDYNILPVISIGFTVFMF